MLTTPPGFTEYVEKPMLAMHCLNLAYIGNMETVSAVMVRRWILLQLYMVVFQQMFPDYPEMGVAGNEDRYSRPPNGKMQWIPL